MLCCVTGSPHAAAILILRRPHRLRTRTAHVPRPTAAKSTPNSSERGGRRPGVQSPLAEVRQFSGRHRFDYSCMKSSFAQRKHISFTSVISRKKVETMSEERKLYFPFNRSLSSVSLQARPEIFSTFLVTIAVLQYDSFFRGFSKEPTTILASLNAKID